MKSKIVMSSFAGAGLTFGLTVSHERSTTEQKTTTKDEKNQVVITVKANSITCVEYAFRMRTRYDEEELEITYNGKKFTGYRLKQDVEQGNVLISPKDIGITEKCT